MSKRRVAVVTGASRGIGRGIATALGERGWIVYVTGRSTGDGELTIDATARLVDECGGTGVPVATDHGDDTQIAALFERVAREQGHLDLLVNNVYTIPDPPAWSGGFWEHPLSIWDDQVGIGLRAHYVASWHAAPLLFAAAPGALIANISSPGGQRYHFNSAYGAGKAGLDRLTADMAIELRDTGVVAVTVYPGLVATEFAASWAERQGLDLDRRADAAPRRPNARRSRRRLRPRGTIRVHPAGRRSRKGVRSHRRRRNPTRRVQLVRCAVADSAPSRLASVDTTERNTPRPHHGDEGRLASALACFKERGCVVKPDAGPGDTLRRFAPR